MNRLLLRLEAATIICGFAACGGSEIVDDTYAAKRHGIVRGQVVNSADLPVSGAAVVLRFLGSTSGPIAGGGTTDTGGLFDITFLGDDQPPFNLDTLRLLVIASSTTQGASGGLVTTTDTAEVLTRLGSRMEAAPITVVRIELP